MCYGHAVKPKTVPMHLRLPADFVEEVQSEAESRRVTYTTVMYERLGIFSSSQGTNTNLTANVTVTPQTTGMTVPSPAPKTSEPMTIKASDIAESCAHPSARLRQVVGGKRCLDCGEVLRGV